MVQNDDNNLVRVRAAEFLALIGEALPQKAIYKALQDAETEVEANLILNTATMLKDGSPSYEFDIRPEWFPQTWRQNERGNVVRRLGYFVD